MNKVFCSALVIAMMYFAGSYYFDRPDAAEGGRMPVGDSEEGADRQVSGAKQRLDFVREKVQDSIALGSERFAGSD